MENSQLGSADYVVFSMVLAVSALIGVYYRLTGGKQQTIQEYFMADKTMSVFPVACSLVASTASAILLLGVPKETYVYGSQFVLIDFGSLLCSFLIVCVYLPVFFKLQATSSYEYLELRFGKAARFMTSMLFVIERVLSISMVLYAPSITLNAVTGMSKWASILSVGLVCTFYSTIGGIKAILWTDVLQLFLMFTAVFSVIIKGIMDGSTEAWNTAVAGGRIEFFNFNPDPTVRFTFWTQVIGGLFLYLTSFGLSQTQIQRLLTVKTLRQSQFVVFLTWVSSSLLWMAAVFAGLVIYSKYYDCDPVLSKRISSSDQLLPIFVMDYLAHIPGLAGLVISGILSGALSTVSSTVNSLAAVTLEDFIKPVLRKEWQSNKVLLVLTKALTCAFGILPVTLTFIVDQFGSMVQAISLVYGIFNGPLAGLFTLGMLCPRSQQKGAIAAYLFGIVFTAWIAIGGSIEKPYIPQLSTSVEGCPAVINNHLVTSLPPNISSKISIPQGRGLTTSTSSNITLDFQETATPDPIQHNENIFYLYRISFMWLPFVGFLTVVLFGALVSLCEKKKSVHVDLLSPVCLRWFPNFTNFDNKEDTSVSNTMLDVRHAQTDGEVEDANPILSNDGIAQTKV